VKRLIALTIVSLLVAWGLSSYGVKAQRGTYSFSAWQPSGYVCPFTDSFTGAANAALSGAWKKRQSTNSSALQQTGSGAVQENTLSSNAFYIAYDTQCPYLNNGQYAQATVTANSTTTGYVGLLVAYNTSINNGYNFQGNGNGGTLMNIYSVTSGAITSLTSCSVTTPTGAVMKFALTGASAPYTLTVYKNGSSVCSTTSSLYAGTNGSPGMSITSDATSVADQELSSFSGD